MLSWRQSFHSVCFSLYSLGFFAVVFAVQHVHFTYGVCLSVVAVVMILKIKNLLQLRLSSNHPHLLMIRLCLAKIHPKLINIIRIIRISNLLITQIPQSMKTSQILMLLITNTMTNKTCKLIKTRFNTINMTMIRQLISMKSNYKVTINLMNTMTKITIEI